MKIHSVNRQTTTTKARRVSICLLALAASLIFTRPASAGTYLTVSLNGEPSDFNGVPVAFTGNAGTPDISTIQLANDNNYLYIGITFTAPINLEFESGGGSLFLAFDTDSNPSTGFNVFGAGTVGSELGYQNDFPFQQSTGNFNSGSVNNGAALVAPFNNSSTSFMDIAVPLSSTFATGGAATFPNQSFDLAVYTQDLVPPDTSDNFTGALAYTLAVPEPNSFALFMSGALVFGIVFRRRSQRRFEPARA
jgi:hypothetical protein